MKLPFTKILALGVASLLSVSAAHAQSYLLELSNGNGSGSVGMYNLNGTPINSTLITGLNNPQFMDLVGNNLYVTEGGGNNGQGSVGVYTLGTGGNLGTVSTFTDPLGAATGLLSAYGISSYKGNIFVSNAFGNQILEFNGATGAAEGTFATFGNNLPVGSVVVGSTLYVASLGGTSQIVAYNAAGPAGESPLFAVNTPVTNGKSNAFGITSNGTDLFVGDQIANAVDEYTLNGTFVKTLITGVGQNVTGMSDFNGDLYVTNYGAGNNAPGDINVYSDTTGQLVGTNPLLTSAGGIVDVTVVGVVPEPSSWALLLGGLGVLAFCVRRRQAQA